MFRTGNVNVLAVQRQRNVQFINALVHLKEKHSRLFKGSHSDQCICTLGYYTETHLMQSLNLLLSLSTGQRIILKLPASKQILVLAASTQTLTKVFGFI